MVLMYPSAHPFKYYISTSNHKGVVFYDMDPLLSCSVVRKLAIAQIARSVATFSPTVILGVESRGFAIAAHLADEMGLGWLMARKAGKTPGEVVQVDYTVEYGEKRTLELKKGLFNASDRVLIVDDVLATGNTAAAMAELVQKVGGTVAGFAFLIDIEGLGGAAKCAPHSVYSLINLKLGEVTPKLPTIHVGTTNKGKLCAVKRAAVKLGFASIKGYDVSSSIPNQPFGLQQTGLGALNRARGALTESDHSGVGLGVENGIVHEECEQLGESWESFSDVVVTTVVSERGEVSAVRSCAVIPPKYYDLVKQSVSDQTVTFGKLLAATDSRISHDNWHTALGAADRYDTIAVCVEDALLKYLGF